MNRLGDATSPYLLQHASNPVDWWPWGDEALAEAERRDVPMLISIGYSSCHWCHVMAHESFEDAATAAVMNEHFVNVKVDREERPDLDAIYMDAVQAMTGQGGWPMTVFLTPEGRPFFAGTYFPAEDRHGLPGFRKVLVAVAEAWRERRDDARRQGDALVEHIGRAAGALAPATGALDEELLRQAFETLRRGFDTDWGGFGAAPKFPQPMTLEFLLRCHLRGYQGALGMVTRTLDRMAAGGIFDQLGGGFHRYSTDRRWLVPHFEKMLYDNAQLLRVYTRAWQVTRSGRYRQVAAATAAYLLRELRHPEGGFYSSQDADTEGVEGRFFVWSHDELVAAGGELAARWFGATPGGNWEGTNVLWTPRAAEEVAAEAGVPVAELERALGEARERLLAARERRMKPGTDDKVLTAWNGLAIAALAEAGRALGDDRLVTAAVDAAGFALDRLRDGGGRLLRSWRAGRRGGPGYLDDYACLAGACLALYETTFAPRWLEEARSLATEMVRLFGDPEGGGFYQTGADAERLVIRPRDLFDNAVPSGSSEAVDVLLRLARVRGDGDAEGRALEALRVVQELLPRAPGAFGHALCAADFALGPVREVAIVGDPAAPDTRALLGQVRDRFRPRQVLALGPGGDGTPEPPLLAGRDRVDGRAAAYVCERFACQLPVTEPEALAAQLGDTV